MRNLTGGSHRFAFASFRFAANASLASPPFRIPNPESRIPA
jgi:hypothetical protein